MQTLQTCSPALHQEIITHHLFPPPQKQYIQHFLLLKQWHIYPWKHLSLLLYRLQKIRLQKIIPKTTPNSPQPVKILVLLCVNG